MPRRSIRSSTSVARIFLNNDTIQNADWIDHLVAKIESDPRIAAVQPKILNYYQKDKFDYAGGAGGEMDFLGFPFAKGRIFNEQEIDAGQYNISEEIFWSSGTAFIVRKNAFAEVGKFDELFFAHMDEIDLCWRFHMSGYQVLSEPNSVVFHKNALTLPMYSEKKYYLNHRNSLIMLISNYKLPLSIYVLPIRWALDIVAVLYAILLGDWNHIKGIMKAHTWIFLHPHQVWKKRRRIKRFRKENDRTVLNRMFRGSIVYSHYILRKNKYSEIHSRGTS